MMRKIQVLKNLLFLTAILLLASCASQQWNKINAGEHDMPPPETIQKVFNKTYGTLNLNALSPAYDYKYDIGEKDANYGLDHVFRFDKVQFKLNESMPEGKVLVEMSFSDGNGNKIVIPEVDLLRLTPKIEGPKELVYSEMLLKEFNRFGFSFRKEFKEFKVLSNPKNSKELNKALNSIYRVSVVNNCLDPGKWELSLVSEDFSDFHLRLKDTKNLNQNKILSHSWFQVDLDLYQELINLKNPGKSIDISLSSSTISDRGEQAYVDFEELRKPLRYSLNTKMVEIGHQSKRKLEPIDQEQFYKKQFGLFLNQKNHDYATILDSTVYLTQFRDAGFYSDTTPNSYDYGWLKYVDEVKIDVIDANNSQSYVQISVGGEWSPFKMVLGNVDLALLDEQKLTGFLFGINTYPKGRRYNPSPNTIAYDADLIPDDIKPYLLLVDNKTGNWVNNQYKGVEKVYISYESLERDVLEIYILSYERIIPVWMAKVKLPTSFRDQIRTKKTLYNY